MSHSRWLTTANRILRLYISTENPSENMTSIVEYIMQVYAPMWFQIKRNPYSTDGAKHLFKMMQLSRSLNEETKAIIDPVIQRNGFFGHPENILLAMIKDQRRHIRELGWRKIKKYRAMQSLQRTFKVPTLNFASTDYTEMIHWQETPSH